MNRTLFIASTLASLVTPPSPTPTSVHITSSSWDLWDKSKALPYDRPLEITLDLLDAGYQRFQLTKYRGTAVILNIFATWCGPCNAEQPHIVASAAKYATQGLAVIGINAEEEDNAVRAYRKKYGITYPIAMDRGGGLTYNLEVGDSGGKELFPVSLFIAPDGYLYGVRQGSMGREELDYRIKHFLAAVSQQLQTSMPSPSPSPG